MATGDAVTCTSAPNSDLLDETEIRDKIKRGDFELIENTNKTISPLWSKLRLIAHSDDLTKVLEGWVACRYCKNIFRTHSKPKSDGTRKNYGLTTPARHMDHCKDQQRQMLNQAASSDAKHVQHHRSSFSTKLISRFLFNKQKLPDKTISRLKDAEIKYIVAGKFERRFYLI